MAHAPLGLRVSVWGLIALVALVGLLVLAMVWVAAREPGGSSPQPQTNHPQSSLHRVAPVRAA